MSRPSSSLNKFIEDVVRWREGTVEKLDQLQSAIKNTKLRQGIQFVLDDGSSFVVYVEREMFSELDSLDI